MTPEAVLASYDVSRETLDRLRVLEVELTRWQAAVNLVGPTALRTFWVRHVADSVQLSDLAPGRAWIDLGSGAGFPGLVIAAADLSRRVTLVESDGRKCAFLRHAARAMGVPADIREGRIENVVSTLARPDVVTARALAPLDRLLAYAAPALKRGGTALFHKGREFERELTLARESWRFNVDLVVSRTDPEARILRITQLESR